MKKRIFAAAAGVIVSSLTLGVCLTLIFFVDAPISISIVGLSAAAGGIASARWSHSLAGRAAEIAFEEKYAESRRAPAPAPRRPAVRYALPADADKVRDRLADALREVGEAARNASVGIEEAVRVANVEIAAAIKPVIETTNAAIRIFPDLETTLGDVSEHIEQIKGEREDFRRRAMLGDAAAAILRGDAPALEKIVSDEKGQGEPAASPPPPEFLQPRRRPAPVAPTRDLENDMAEELGRVFPGAAV